MESKSFIKNIGGDVWKLIQTHIIMMIFGLMVYLPVGVETPTKRTLTLIFSICTIIFYYYLIDLYMWDVGAKDSISAKGNGENPILVKGFVTELFAAVPDFVFGLLYFIFNYFREYSTAMTSLNTVFSMLSQTWEAMFFGIKMVIFGGNSGGWFYLLTPFIAAAFAGISYYCGTKEFTLIPRPKK